MASLNQSKRKVALLWLTGLGCLAILCFSVWWRFDGVSVDAVVRETVGQRLLDHWRDGRQALVGSVWWAPLPTLLRMPFAYLFGGNFPGLPSLIVSASFGAALLLLLNHILRIQQVGKIRFLLIATLAFQPLFLRHCLDGSSDTTVAFLVLLFAYSLELWIRARKLRALVVLGVGGSFLVLSSMPMALWLMLALAVLALLPPLPGVALPEKKAVALLILWPILYAVGLWVLSNWLILGDGFYFVRSLFFEKDAADGTGALLHIARRADYWPAACAVLLLAVAIIKRDRRATAVSLVCLAPVAVAAALMLAGHLSNLAPILFVLLPLAIFAMASMAGISASSLWLRRLWLAAALALCALTLFQYRPGADALGNIMSRAVTAEVRGRDEALLSLIRGAVVKNSTKAKVFVCGYDSYVLLGSRPDQLFMPAMDFNFYQAVEDYPGYQLYLLVHRPKGDSAFDSIHWTYPRLFSRGHRNLIYYEDWGEWRLFELVQAPRKEGI